MVAHGNQSPVKTKKGMVAAMGKKQKKERTTVHSCTIPVERMPTELPLTAVGMYVASNSNKAQGGKSQNILIVTSNQ
jgi:hypothetical protein